MVYWSEVEQEPYDPEEFVERLAWRTVGHGGGGQQPAMGGLSSGGHQGNAPTNSAEPEDSALLLHDAFVQAIKDLTVMHETQAKKCQELEQACRDDEQLHWKRVAGLIERNRNAASTYKSLDEKINSVATKVVHLGDQLESINTPRSRDVEALRLMKHFEEFLGGETALSPVFNDKSRLHEAADIILKLQLIATELPKKDERFFKAVKAIEAKYSEIEKALIEEFVRSHRSEDHVRMKDIALKLSQFKGYNRCIDEFIGQIQSSQDHYLHRRSMNTSLLSVDGGGSSNIFRDIVPLCESSWKLIDQVFPNPQQVMSKFILNIYHNKLKEYVAQELEDKSSSERYLMKLYSCYSQTTKLTSDLAKFNFGPDQLFLTNLTRAIFRSYLDNYINMECSYLNDKCSQILRSFYASKNHQKKPNTGNEKLQDLKRDLHGFIASKAGIESSSAYVNLGGETLLSDEVAINILQLTKDAFKRCTALSHEKDQANNALEIQGILYSYLVHEHVNYALDLGLQGIPISETKTIPEIYFFDVVNTVNTIVVLLEKQFNDSVLPLIESTPKHSDGLQRKKNELEKLEAKMDAGLDRSLNTAVGWVRTVLLQEQKRSDYFNTAEMAMTSPACSRVIKWMDRIVEKIRKSLDGRNIEVALTELGARFHRVIYEHLQQFTYDSAGVMAALCDVQEYRRCAGKFELPEINALFDTLHAMCNLLVIHPENLRNAMQGDQLAALDRTILENWIQLRADYKTEKLGSFI